MIWKNGRTCMTWYIGLSLAIVTAILFLYKININIDIELREDDLYKGLSIDIATSWYKLKKEYNYTDPEFSLLEKIIIGRIEAVLASDLPMLPAKQFYQHLKKYLSIYQNQPYSKILRMLLDKSTAMKLKWKTNIGCQDAMQTALSAGFFWSIKGVLVALLSKNYKLKNLSLDVRPDFSKSVLLSNFNCILSIRMVHYIFIAIYAIVLKVR